MQIRSFLEDLSLRRRIARGKRVCEKNVNTRYSPRFIRISPHDLGEGHGAQLLENAGGEAMGARPTVDR
jgi:hypothetical protein